MFELMIPNRLKGSFKDLNSVLFILDQEAAQYPWELIYDRRTGQDKPLVVQVGMIRQFSTTSFQERVVDVNNKNILVVGNPANMPAGFADLPGAQQEAALVANKFREYKYDVYPEINTGSNAIMNSLFANDYRVLHLAGHGVFRFPFKLSENDEAELFTGMVLGDGVFLTANEIKNKMDIPELVFINCCHLGKLDSPGAAAGYAFNEFAASLSEELIKMGVKAVIAAGWAVDDAAALTFAEVFYDHLLKGDTFGDAVKEARRETYRLHQDRTNTWAAYQCYGDPAYRLVASKGEARKEVDKFVDIEEAVFEIRKLSGSAKASSAQGITSLRDGLVSLQKKIESECPVWLEDSGLQEALGEAYGEMFWFDKAIEYYQLAIENQNCRASIKAIEQLANCRIRLAVRTLENDPGYYKEAKAAIETQIDELILLMKAVGKTSERWSMVGSGYKRLAQISSAKPSKVCDQALEEMEAAYNQAWELAKDKSYPLTNVLAAKVTRSLRSDDPDGIKKSIPELVTLTEKAARLAESEYLNSPEDFWASIASTDVKLIDSIVKYMREGSKDFNVEIFDDLVQEYKTTWKRYGSMRELNSVIEHHAFLAAVLGGIEAHKTLSGSLEKSLSALNSIME